MASLTQTRKRFADLTEARVTAIKDVVEVCIDSHKGFEEAARVVRDESLRSLLSELAAQRRTFADELRRALEREGEAFEPRGSWTARLHRGWMDLRALLSGGRENGILRETRRGELVVKELYEEGVGAALGTDIGDILARHLQAVERGLARLNMLIDATDAA